VLIGDHKQLPPLIHSSGTLDLGLHESLFERLRRLGVPTKLLTVQYRMHPAIAAFPSFAFYQSKLTNGLGPEARRAPMGYYWPDPNAPLCFEGIGDEDALLEERMGTSLQNKTECYRVNQIIEGLLHAGDVPASEIAVLTPYAAQASLLRSQLRSKGISASTVDSYQGRETDVVICSTVRCAPKRGVGFLSDKRRFNVLLTRARRGLIVCGHEATLRLDNCWRDWIEHVAQHRLWNGTFGDISQQAIQESQKNRTEGFEAEEADMSRVKPEKLSGPGRWMSFSDGIWPEKLPEIAKPVNTPRGPPNEDLKQVSEALEKMFAPDKGDNAMDSEKTEDVGAGDLSAVIEAAAQSARQKASSTWRIKALIAAQNGPGPLASASQRVKQLLTNMDVEIPNMKFSEHGPPHNRVFTATMQLPGQTDDGEQLQARGTAGTKKDAERYCFEDAWKVLTGEAPPQQQQQQQQQQAPLTQMLALPAPQEPLALTNAPANNSAAWSAPTAVAPAHDPQPGTLQDLLSLGVDLQSVVQGSGDDELFFFPPSLPSAGPSGALPPGEVAGSSQSASASASHQGHSLGWLKQKLSRSRLFHGANLPLEMAAEGPPHNRTFTATLLVPLHTGPQQAMGQARTKKEAERLCCEHAVSMLGW